MRSQSKPSLTRSMTWYRAGDRPSSESMKALWTNAYIHHLAIVCQCGTHKHLHQNLEAARATVQHPPATPGVVSMTAKVIDSGDQAAAQLTIVPWCDLEYIQMDGKRIPVG